LSEDLHASYLEVEDNDAFHEPRWEFMPSDMPPDDRKPTEKASGDNLCCLNPVNLAVVSESCVSAPIMPVPNDIPESNCSGATATFSSAVPAEHKPITESDAEHFVGILHIPDECHDAIAVPFILPFSNLSMATCNHKIHNISSNHSRNDIPPESFQTEPMVTTERGYSLIDHASQACIAMQTMGSDDTRKKLHVTLRGSMKKGVAAHSIKVMRMLKEETLKDLRNRGCEILAEELEAFDLPDAVTSNTSPNRGARNFSKTLLSRDQGQSDEQRRTSGEGISPKATTAPFSPKRLPFDSGEPSQLAPDSKLLTEYPPTITNRCSVELETDASGHASAQSVSPDRDSTFNANIEVDPSHENEALQKFYDWNASEKPNDPSTLGVESGGSASSPPQLRLQASGSSRIYGGYNEKNKGDFASLDIKRPNSDNEELDILPRQRSSSKRRDEYTENVAASNNFASPSSLHSSSSASTLPNTSRRSSSSDRGSVKSMSSSFSEQHSRKHSVRFNLQSSIWSPNVPKSNSTVKATSNAAAAARSSETPSDSRKFLLYASEEDQRGIKSLHDVGAKYNVRNSSTVGRDVVQASQHLPNLRRRITLPPELQMTKLTSTDVDRGGNGKQKEMSKDSTNIVSPSPFFSSTLEIVQPQHVHNGNENSHPLESDQLSLQIATSIMNPYVEKNLYAQGEGEKPCVSELRFPDSHMKYRNLHNRSSNKTSLITVRTRTRSLSPQILGAEELKRERRRWRREWRQKQQQRPLNVVVPADLTRKQRKYDFGDLDRQRFGDIGYGPDWGDKAEEHMRWVEAWVDPDCRAEREDKQFRKTLRVEGDREKEVARIGADRLSFVAGLASLVGMRWLYDRLAPELDLRALEEKFERGSNQSPTESPKSILKKTQIGSWAGDIVNRNRQGETSGRRGSSASNSGA